MYLNDNRHKGASNRVRPFTVFLGIYVLVLTIAIAAGLIVLWQYLSVYEDARPEKAIADYEQGQLHEEYRLQMAALAERAATPLQNAEEIRPFLEPDGAKLSLRRSLQGGGHPFVTYAIQQGKQQVGTVYLRPVQLRFGLTGFQFDHSEWFLPEIPGEKYTLDVPIQAVVSVENTELTAKNCTVEEFDLPQTALTEGFPPQRKKRYTFSFYGQPAISVSSPDSELQIQREGNHWEANEVCSDALTKELTAFAERFVRDFTAFSSHAASFARASKHLIPETALFKRVSGTVDGMRWVEGVTAKLDNVQIESITRYGEGAVCHASYQLTDTKGNTQQMQMDILAVQRDGVWKAYNIQVF